MRSSERGFSLAETLISVGLLATVAMGVAQLFAVSADTNRSAKVQTSAATLAAQKMEQLRSLTWGFDTEGLGLPLSDVTTNVAVDPPTNDGAGLNPSPSGTLDTNVAGYHDFLRGDGTWAGTGGQVPPDAIYLRRWSIEPLPTNPNNTLVIQVLVTTVVREAARDANQQRRRLAGDAWLVSVKTRKAA